MYANKAMDILDRVVTYPNLKRVCRMGVLDIKQILYVSPAQIAEAARKCDPNNKMLQKLTDLFENHKKKTTSE